MQHFAFGAKTKTRAIFSVLLISLLSLVTTPSHAEELSELSPDSLFSRILAKNQHTLFETVVAQGIEQSAVEAAFDYFDAHRSEIKNQKYMTLVDFSQHISAKRMHLINLETGEVEHIEVAHALNSDPERTGFPVVFGNVFNSEKTALGFFLTLHDYQGTLGRGLALKGLSVTNSRTFQRKIVLHPWYVGSEHSKKYGSKECPLKGGCPTMGCFGVPFASSNAIIDKLKAGSLLYAFTDLSSMRSNDY